MPKFNVFIKPFHNSDFKIRLLVLYFLKKTNYKITKKLILCHGTQIQKYY